MIGGITRGRGRDIYMGAYFVLVQWFLRAWYLDMHFHLHSLKHVMEVVRHSMVHAGDWWRGGAGSAGFVGSTTVPRKKGHSGDEDMH